MTKQVLLVEDEPDVARLVEFNLRSAGFEVQSVARGADALARAKAAPPHVVVLDLMLPDISGYDVCKALRAGPRLLARGPARRGLGHARRDQRAHGRRPRAPAAHEPGRRRRRGRDRPRLRVPGAERRVVASRWHLSVRARLIATYVLLVVAV